MTPERTCIACRGRAPQSELLRLVRRGDLVVDGTSPRLPGRGGYVHHGCLDLAGKRQSIRRNFGSGAVLDPSVGAPGGSSGDGGLR
ncbi:hypothetical protein BW730_03765 [Tessaracoccus aquimaris]|uniref:YlxR domain-containing protein n=1 Tax=Tessaracoccus aquimaris TaxID=1332264 RepID=A0A1Q2CL26_9ACTN|nr:hypothetical protein BW730_03765 [Tessaracoccus aquimaris]